MWSLMKRLVKQLDSKIPFSSLRQAHDKATDENIKRTLSRAIQASNPDRFMDDKKASEVVSKGLKIAKVVNERS